MSNIEETVVVVNSATTGNGEASANCHAATSVAGDPSVKVMDSIKIYRLPLGVASL
jgi:hypothetical protein